MKKINLIYEKALTVSAVLGIAVVILPLYIYPMATIDPIEAYPFYASPDFIKIFLPYALIFFASSIGIFLKKRFAVVVLLISFLVSHFHFAAYFSQRLVFKPVFVVVFILVPAAIFLLGAMTVLSDKGKGES